MSEKTLSTEGFVKDKDLSSEAYVKMTLADIQRNVETFIEPPEGLKIGEFDPFLLGRAIKEMCADIADGSFFKDWVGSTGIKLRDMGNEWIRETEEKRTQYIDSQREQGIDIPKQVGKKAEEQVAPIHSPTGQILLSVMRLIRESNQYGANLAFIEKFNQIAAETDPITRASLSAEFMYENLNKLLYLAAREYADRKELIKLIQEQKADGFNKWREENPDAKVDLLGSNWDGDGVTELAYYNFDGADMRFVAMPFTMNACDLNNVCLDGATSGTYSTGIEGGAFKDGSAQYIRGIWQFKAVDLDNTSFDGSSVSGLALHSAVTRCSFKGLKAGWLLTNNEIFGCDMRKASIGRVEPQGESRWTANDLRGVTIEAVSLQQNSDDTRVNWLMTSAYSRPLPNAPQAVQALLDPLNGNIEMTNADTPPFETGLRTKR